MFRPIRSCTRVMLSTRPPQRVGGARHRQQVRSIDALPACTRPDAPTRAPARCAATSAASRFRCSSSGGASAASDSATPCSETAMRRADSLEPGQPRSAVDHVVLGMHFEPQARRLRRRCAASKCCGFSPSPALNMGSLRGSSRGRSARRACTVPGKAGATRPQPMSAHQVLIGVSEPLPFGVAIDVQVPFGTAFHALPW